MNIVYVTYRPLVRLL